ncbi:methylated-DNA--protein-cysteine methyltransferase, constitutive [Clostridia bacterium]|nr:methylated-DNA--protein-cysteine methyltransferase, constitutive [Clostridia bacterium]
MLTYFIKTKTPIGEFFIVEQDGEITEITQELPIGAENAETPALISAITQIDEYFEHKRTKFTLPVNPRGTAFQRAAWRETAAIPYGETRSYGEIAALIGKPKAARAVGTALKYNPIAIIVPCHRVIAKSGKMAGFAWGLDTKEFLLAHERQ